MGSSTMQFMTKVVLAASVALGACAAPVESEKLGETQEAITNGDNDDADPAVVALMVNGQVSCTGVLVSSHIVATAGHCVSLQPPTQVYFGAKPSAKKGTFIDVADTLPFPDFDEDTLANDIGLVALKDKAPVAPIPVLTREMDASFVKMPIRLVGFGAQSATDDGNIRKRRGETVIDSISTDFFKFHPGPSQTCNGDSGGPAIATIDGKEAVVGLTSSGDSGCKEYGSDIRIDRFVPFITTFAQKYSRQLAADDSKGGCSASPKPASGASWALAIAAASLLFLRRRRPAR